MKLEVRSCPVALLASRNCACFVAPASRPLTAAGRVRPITRVEIRVDGGHGVGLCLEQAVFSSTATMPPMRSSCRARLSFDQVHGLVSSNWIRCWITSPILGQIADEGSICPQGQRGLRTALQIAAHEAVLGHAETPAPLRMPWSQAEEPYFLASESTPMMRRIPYLSWRW